MMMIYDTRPLSLRIYAPGFQVAPTIHGGSKHCARNIFDMWSNVVAGLIDRGFVEIYWGSARLLHRTNILGPARILPVHGVGSAPGRSRFVFHETAHRNIAHRGLLGCSIDRRRGWCLRTRAHGSWTRSHTFLKCYWPPQTQGHAEGTAADVRGWVAIDSELRHCGGGRGRTHLDREQSGVQRKRFECAGAAASKLKKKLRPAGRKFFFNLEVLT